MTIQIEFAGLLVYLLVFVRFLGMIVFNPVLMRSAVPSMVRIGIALLLTLIIAPMQPIEQVLEMSTVEYTFAAIKELGIGFVYGMVFIIFYYLMYYVGDRVDMDIGMAMAKSMDPGANVQTGFAGSYFTTIFVLYYFASGCFHTTIRMFANSFVAIPPGVVQFSVPIYEFVIDLFIAIFLLALRMVAPFMVAEFVLQCAMGILMKFVPQITIFVINFQLRIMLGMLMLLVFTPYVAEFIDSYISVMFDNMADIPALFVGSATG